MYANQRRNRVPTLSRPSEKERCRTMREATRELVIVSTHASQRIRASGDSEGGDEHRGHCYVNAGYLLSQIHILMRVTAFSS